MAAAAVSSDDSSRAPEVVPWEDDDLAADLLRSSLQAAADVLGTAETHQVCSEYLALLDEEAIVRKVTITGACVASVHSHHNSGDVFVPAAVMPESHAVAGRRILVTMIKTSTGRSAFLALKAEQVEDDDNDDDGWRPVVRNKGAGKKGKKGDEHRQQYAVKGGKGGAHRSRKP